MRRKRYVAGLFFLVLMGWFYTDHAHAWTETRNFEDEPVGQVLMFSGTTGSDVNAAFGTRSAKVEFPVGSDCWGVCGGVISFPGNIYEGGEVWARGYFYFATPWSWTASPYIKIFRLPVPGAGAISILANSFGNITVNNEPQPMTYNSSVPFTLNGWQTLEMYVKLSATVGIVRAWKDGTLVFEDKTRKTMGTSDQYANQAYIFTYWNGGVPQTQYGWIDEFAFTNDRPLNQDANGNYMIGPIGWSNGITTYIITPSAGSNGTISPNISQTVNSGSITTFAVTSNPGYTASIGGTCGGNLSGTTYTTNAITANCTVVASFAAIGDTTPPTSPTNLAANAMGETSITVSWDPSVDDVGIVRYDIERCPGLSCSNFTQVGTTQNSPYTDSGLTASTGYSYHVRVVDAAGNVSGWSNVVSATTQGSPTFSSCSTITPTNFTDPTYTGYGAPYDVFASNTPLISTQCSSTDTHTLTATLGIPGDTTRIVYTKGYYYDPGINDWTSFTGTCTGALNGEWCQGSVATSITDTDISTASVSDPSYLVGFTCRSQNGSWKCGCRDTSCTNFYWQVQGAGM